MRRFVITSPRFNGEAVLVYNDKEVVCIIDVSRTDMDMETVHAFKRAAPITIEVLASGKAFATETIVREEGVVITFEQFYAIYPHKRNRYKAEKAWQKMNDTDRLLAFHNVPYYERYLKSTGWLNPKLPSTYLTEREFETDWNKLKK